MSRKKMYTMRKATALLMFCGSFGLALTDVEAQSGRKGSKTTNKLKILAYRPGTLKITQDGNGGWIYSRADNPGNPESGGRRNIKMEYIAYKSPRSKTDRGRAGLGKRKFDWRRSWGATGYIDVGYAEFDPVSANVGWRLTMSQGGTPHNGGAGVASNASAFQGGVEVSGVRVPIALALSVVAQQRGRTDMNPITHSKTEKFETIHANEDTAAEHPVNYDSPLSREITAWVNAEKVHGTRSSAYAEISLSVGAAEGTKQFSVIQAYPFVPWPLGTAGQVKR